MTIKSVSSAIVAGFIASASQAQSAAPVSPGWSAFSGCWAPVPVQGRAIPTSSPTICVIPSGTNGADLVSIVDSAITERTHIEADGRRKDVARQGCSGWESASFSADGRRLYLDSEQQCAGNLTRKASGLFAMASDGQFLNIVNVAAEGGEGLRVVRYTPVPATSALPADVFAALDARALSDRTARVAAQARVSVDAVIEANKFLNAGAVQAWIAELDQKFSLDEKSLVRLADARVPTSVIDVMVAVSNPGYFAVSATGASVEATEVVSSGRAASRQPECLSPMVDPWGYYEYDSCDPYRRYGYYGSRGYGYGRDSRYGYNAYDPYGYNAYGYNSGYGRPVVIVVRGSETPPARGGRMTRDGYVSGTQGSSGSASGSTGSTPSTSSSSGSSSSGSTAETSSSSGSSSGRTATRKPPVD